MAILFSLDSCYDKGTQSARSQKFKFFISLQNVLVLAQFYLHEKGWFIFLIFWIWEVLVLDLAKFLSRLVGEKMVSNKVCESTYQIVSYRACY